MLILGLLARAVSAARSACRPPSIAPRRALRASGFAPRRSFEVLNLLAHLLDRHLELERHLRQLGVDRLGSQGVGFAVQFLGEEIEPLAGAAAVCQYPPEFG